MPIAIRGIRLTVITITPDEKGEERITGNYSLISTQDKVLATQSVGGYNGLTLNPSPATQKAMEEFIRLFRNDIHTLIGLEVE